MPDSRPCWPSRSLRTQSSGMSCEKNRRRTGPPRTGAPNDRSGPERASITVHCGHERERLALPETPGSQRGPTATNRGPCTTRHAFRCGNDLFDASTGGRACEPHAGGTAVSGRTLTGTSLSAQKSAFARSAVNTVWSIDCVFDRTADARVLKCQTSVDDATHEAVTIDVVRAILGSGLVN